MSAKIKIGIVEDELLIAEKIKSILLKLGYDVCEPAINYDDALKMIEKEKPDLLLLDIQLKDKKDGINLAETINKQFGIPFIFLSANTDASSLERAKAVMPLTYLPKPFTKEVLYTTIEVAFNNFNLAKQKALNLTGSGKVDSAGLTNESVKVQTKEYIFVKDGTLFRKLFFKEISYIDSDHNYITVFLVNNKKILLRTTLSEFETQLPSEMFMRIHRSYVINLTLVEAVDRLDVTMAGGAKVGIGSSYHEELLKRLGI